jgi:hypothetical protein
VVDTVHPVDPIRVLHRPETYPTFVQPALFDLPPNSGAEAADKAAREEEQRLMNMGGALRTGINMAAEDIPVLDISSSGHVRSDLPDVNWGA